MRKVKCQEASRTDDWNAEKAQYQGIAEALIQFSVAQAAVYTYIIQKLAEEQEAATCTSACSPTPEPLEAQHVDLSVEESPVEELPVKEMPSEEPPEESYLETPKPVETEHPIPSSLSCVRLTPPSPVLKPTPPPYIEPYARPPMESVPLPEIEPND